MSLLNPGLNLLFLAFSNMSLLNPGLSTR
jgi:hypothetical protein